MACSFHVITGSECGSHPRLPKHGNTVVPLETCNWDISSHLDVFRVTTSITSENSLILARVGIFEPMDFTICPAHRGKLGIHWKCRTKRCQVPNDIASHSSNKKQPPIGDRGVGFYQSKKIMESIRILVPVGSAICSNCRKLLKGENVLKEQPGKPQASALELAGDFASLAMESPSEGEDSENGIESQQVPETPGYIPQTTEESTSSEEESSEASEITPQQLLNKFLTSCGLQKPNILTSTWQEAHPRTKRLHLKQIGDAVSAVLNVLTPGEAESVWLDLKESSIMSPCLGINKDQIQSETVDALVECYNNATTWDTKRQILSIMADKLTIRQLQALLPGLSEYKVSIARKHSLEHGRGTPVEQSHTPRIKIDVNKLDHFLSFITSGHVVQDMPFGERVLKLSTGEKLRVPNVIRVMIPERIITQYEQYCIETGFTPIRRSTLRTIIKECSASIRKCLQGLDYYAVQNGEAFVDLHSVVDRLVTLGMSQAWGREQDVRLRSSKQYLTGDYKVHVEVSSTVADHCIPHSLSSDADEGCHHTHTDLCESCDTLNDVISDITSAVGNVPLSSWEVKDDLTYTLETAQENIMAFKAHQLRYVNQEKARMGVLDQLTEERLLLTQDWAMKYLPIKYRESQSQWFGKRGISWHITVATRLNNGKFETETLVHVFQRCSQDSSVVASIMDHATKTVTEDCPNLQEVVYRSDNAACYHNATVLQSMPSICKRYDFSEPQGGKGPCDRMAATIKGHIAIYINEGHDVQTAEDFKAAIQSYGGIDGVKVFLCKNPEKIAPPKPLEKITQYTNFEFEEDGIYAWKAYRVGKATFIPAEDLDCIAVSSLNVTSSPSREGSAFKVVQPRHCKEVEMSSESSSASAQIHLADPGLFPCPEEGCIKTFRRMANLNNHLICGKHETALDKHTFHDQAKLLYAEKLESDKRDVPVMQTTVRAPGDRQGISVIPKGWALHKRKKAQRFNEKQKQFLNERFNQGETTGHKCNPNSVSKEMRIKKNDQGNRMFERSEYLSTQQVAAYFSRLSAKIRGLAPTELDTRPDDIDTLLQSVISAVGLQHPIVSNTHNICNLVHTGNLSSLSMRLLKDICNDLDVDILDVVDKRKKSEYEKKIIALVKSCSCKL